MRTVEVDIGNGRTAKVIYPERKDFDDNLSGGVQFGFAYVTTWLIEHAGHLLGTFGGSALVGFLEQIEPHLVEIYSPLIDGLLDNPDLPDFFKEFLEELKSPESEAASTVLNAVLGSAAGGATGGLLGAVLALPTYAVNRQFEPARPSPVEAINMDWRMEKYDELVKGWLKDTGWSEELRDGFREIIRPRPSTPDLLAWAWRVHQDPEAAREELEKRGYDPDAIDQLFELAKRRLDVADLLNYVWRTERDPKKAKDALIQLGYPGEEADKLIEISKARLNPRDLVAWAWREGKKPETIKDEIMAQGYPEPEADRLLKVLEFIPGIGDLVSMAVREAWRDDVAAKYGYDEDYPAEFEEWAEKQGLSPEWAKRYWRAHWNLPGPTMAREMLWRTSMTEDDYKTLLRIADYPRAFRDWMTEISYTPYTRVDVRRMHKLGVLEPKDLKTAYMDLGYDDEHAENMKRFTILYNMEAELEYTKSEILKGYRLGMLRREDAEPLLEALGNSPQYVDYLLDLEDYKRANSEIAEHLKHIKTLYVAGEIDRTEATGRLGRLDLEADRIARYLDMWTIAREAKTARPTRAMIEEYYKDGIIDEATARIELSKRHYQPYVIDWMLLDWDQEIADKARKEAERAQKEQERMARATFKTDRSMALANLNREIAELKLLIAEWKVASFYAETDEQISTLKEAIIKAKAEIARLQLEKARLPVVPEERR